MIRFTQRVVELLEPALDLGVEVLLGKDGVDLNTMMKSHCILKSVDGNIVAFCRYDQEFLIESKWIVPKNQTWYLKSELANDNTYRGWVEFHYH